MSPRVMGRILYAFGLLASLFAIIEPGTQILPAVIGGLGIGVGAALGWDE